MPAIMNQIITTSMAIANGLRLFCTVLIDTMKNPLQLVCAQSYL